MSDAFVDSSAIVAIALAESGSEAVAGRLRGFDRWFAANLLEAELRAVCARENLDFLPHLLKGVTWVFPERPLTFEMEAALAVGQLRGADLWHVATALSIAPVPGEMSFVTLDRRQQEVAAKLGFRV